MPYISAPALGAFTIENSAVQTGAALIEWKIDAAIAEIGCRHVTDNPVNCFEVMHRGRLKLGVADVAGIAEVVKLAFDPDFVKS